MSTEARAASVMDDIQQIVQLCELTIIRDSANAEALNEIQSSLMAAQSATTRPSFVSNVSEALEICDAEIPDDPSSERLSDLQEQLQEVREVLEADGFEVKS